MSKSYMEAWENLLNQSRFAWWEWDAITNKVIHNPRKATMLGYDPETFYGGGYQGFTDLIHPDDHEEAMQAMRDVLMGKTTLYQSDYRIKAADGKYLWFMDRGIITETDAEGNPARIRGIVIDLGLEHDRGTDVDALVAVFKESHTADSRGVSMITVCSSCLKLKHGRDEWTELPEDLTSILGEEVSHGLCPSCLHALYPDIAETVLKKVA